jgi:hypothetical protein
MDYNDLLAQVVDTLGSQVTTAQAAALLPFVEARFNRTINSPKREVTVYAVPTSDVSLPTDCWQLRDVWLDGSPPVTLEQMAPDEARRLYGLRSGNPVAYVMSGTTLDLFPTPAATATGTVFLRYQQTIPALGDAQASNWLLAAHPDIYYYGLLLQCEAYIVNDERLGLWKSALDEALGELDRLNAKQRYGASPLYRKPYVAA